MSLVAKRYSPALVDAAREEGVLDAVLADVGKLRELISTSPEFVAFLEHPLIPVEKQEETLVALFEGKLQPVTLHFLRLLAQKERLGDLSDILVAFEAAMDEENGILNVRVTAAEKLLARQETDLQDKLSKRTGKTIRLHSGVDESLIGGFLVQIGDGIEDYSLAAKLATFKRNVINA